MKLRFAGKAMPGRHGRGEPWARFDRAPAISSAPTVAPDCHPGPRDAGRGAEREQRVGLEPPRERAGRGERAFERPAERAERSLGGGAGSAGEATGANTRKPAATVLRFPRPESAR